MLMSVVPGILTCISAWLLVRPKQEKWHPYTLTRKRARYVYFSAFTVLAIGYSIYFLVTRASPAMLGMSLSVLGAYMFWTLFDHPQKSAGSAAVPGHQ
jgi:uncharacterized membrane protein